MRTRWERERAAWLTQHARTGVARRRAERMTRRARQQERDAAGLGSAVEHQSITPWLGHRVTRHDHAGERRARGLLLLVLAVAALLLIPEALIVAVLAYGVWWAVSPWLGRMRWWPYLVAAAAVLVAGWTVGGVQEAWLYWQQPPPIALSGVPESRVWCEVALGLALAGLHVRRAGWAAVRKATPTRQTTPPPSPKEDQLHWPV